MAAAGNWKIKLSSAEGKCCGTWKIANVNKQWMEGTRLQKFQKSCRSRGINLSKCEISNIFNMGSHTKKRGQLLHLTEKRRKSEYPKKVRIP